MKLELDMNSAKFKEMLLRKGLGEQSKNFFDKIIQMCLVDEEIANNIGTIRIYLLTGTTIDSRFEKFSFKSEKLDENLTISIAEDFEYIKDLYIHENLGLDYGKLIPLFELYGFTVERKEHSWLSDYYTLTFDSF